MLLYEFWLTSEVGFNMPPCAAVSFEPDRSPDIHNCCGVCYVRCVGGGDSKSDKMIAVADLSMA